MHHFFSMTPDDLAALARSLELPRYLPDQLRRWVYERRVVDPMVMTDIAEPVRRTLASALVFDRGRPLAHEVATDGTQKLLLEWPDDDAPAALPIAGGSGRETECVMIPAPKRRTACISSQAGCPVGCRFCASGIGGLEGNLTTGQIVEQVHRLGRLDGGQRVTNVVFMGMGEPLANYGAVTAAIRIINAPWGLGISARRITVSTVGLPAAIRRLVSFDVPVTLALSLHAPDDDIRRELIPWAEYATIEELLDACDEYFRATGREITLEYILIRGVNDRVAHARGLAELARRLRANVNLIRYNEVKGLPYDRPRTADVHAFQQELRRRHVNAHIRASRGRDIAAACGQLRHEKRAEGETPIARADG